VDERVSVRTEASGDICISRPGYGFVWLDAAAAETVRERLNEMAPDQRRADHLAS